MLRAACFAHAGYLDEVQFSNVARSADWIQQSFRAQNGWMTYVWGFLAGRTLLAGYGSCLGRAFRFRKPTLRLRPHLRPHLNRTSLTFVTTYGSALWTGVALMLLLCRVQDCESPRNYLGSTVVTSPFMLSLYLVVDLQCGCVSTT